MKRLLVLFALTMTAMAQINQPTSGGTAANVPWSGVTAPTTNVNLAVAGLTTTFTAGATTGTNNIFTITDTASNTGTGYMLSLVQASSSTEKMLSISTLGGLETTTVDASGRWFISTGPSTNGSTSDLNITDIEGDSANQWPVGITCANLTAGSNHRCYIALGNALGTGNDGFLIGYNFVSAGSTSNIFQVSPVGNATPFLSSDFNGNFAVTGSITNAAARRGTFVCTSGGTITISNANFQLTSDVSITLHTAGGTISTTPAMKTVTASTGFTVLCATSDTSTYNYNIWN